MPSLLVTTQEKVPRSSRDGLLKIALDLEARREESAKEESFRSQEVANVCDTYLPRSLIIVRREGSAMAW